MIVNGKDFLIGSNNPNLPNMSDTIVDWFLPIVFGIVAKSVVAGRVVETITDIETSGVVQPLKPEAIARKPEGTRSWVWLQIHCLPEVALKNDEIISYKGKRYRVDARLNYTDYGYIEYHICEAFTNGEE